MIRTMSRVLSIVVVAVSLWLAWPVPKGHWYVLLFVAPSLVFIWFPEQVDEYTFGVWRYGNQVNSHSPPVMIAIVGWVILLVHVASVVDPNFIARMFGVA